jgi:hypothetical protein
MVGPHMTARFLSLLLCVVIAGLGLRPSALLGSAPAPGGARMSCCCPPADTAPAHRADDRGCQCTPAPAPQPDRTAVPNGAVNDFFLLLALRLSPADGPEHLLPEPFPDASERPSAMIPAAIPPARPGDAPLFVRYCSYLT